MKKEMTKHDNKMGVVENKGIEGVPAYLKDYAGGKALQSMGSDDVILPRVKLLQGLSPELQVYESAKAGIFWHNILNEPLGAGFRFVVCSDRKRYLLSVPLGGSPEGILARSDDGVTWTPPSGEWSVKLGPKYPKPVLWKITSPNVRESGLANFGSSDPNDPSSAPAAVLFYDYVCYLPDHPALSPVLLSLSRSQIKKGKDLNSKIEIRAARQPLQSMVFTANSFVDKSNLGPFHNYQFLSDGTCTEDEYNTAMRIKERFATYRAADEEGAVHGDTGGRGPMVNDDGTIPF